MSAAERKQLAQEVANREAAFRAQLPGQLNMTDSLTSIGQQTGAPGPINPAEIPSVAALANLRASAQTASQEREQQIRTRRRQAGSYIGAYRKYLKWRYPSVYGGGSSGGGGSPLPSYELPALTLPTLPELNR